MDSVAPPPPPPSSSSGHSSAAADAAASAAGPSSAASAAVSPASAASAPQILDGGQVPEAPHWFQIGEKMERNTNTDGAKQMAMRTAIRSNVAENVLLRNALAQVNDALSDGGAEGLRGSINGLQERLDTYEGNFQNFIGYRQNLRDGGAVAQISDVRGNLFGKKPLSILLRSAVQSALVVGTIAGLQMATVEALRALYTANPDLLPDDMRDELVEAVKKDALEGVRPEGVSPIPTVDEDSGLTEDDLLDIHAAVAQLPALEIAAIARQGEQLSDEQLEKLIDDASKPGSTYIDEGPASKSEIIGVEAGVGFARGIGLAAADSYTEAGLRENAVQAALQGAPADERGLWGVAGQTATTSAKAQTIGGLISLAVASAVSVPSQLSRGEGGGTIGTEFGKNAGFTVLSGSAFVAIDVLRKTCPGLRDMTGEGRQQATKAAIRVASRIAVQYIKTGLAAATTGAAPAAVYNLRNVMQGALGGAFKEGYGAAAQTLVSRFMPPDDLLRQSLGKTLEGIVQLRQALEQEQLEGDAATARDTAVVALNQTITELQEADGLHVAAPGIADRWADYNTLLDERRDGVDAAPLEEIVVEGADGRSVGSSSVPDVPPLTAADFEREGGSIV